MPKTLKDLRRGVDRFFDKRAIERAIVPPAEKRFERAVARMKKALMNTDIGRALWKRQSGRSPSKTPELIFTTPRARRVHDGVELKSGLVGMGAIVEAGGRTDPHDIVAKRADKLVFSGTGALRGDVVAVRSVRHPGTVVRPSGVAAPEFEAEMAGVDEDAAKAIQAHASRSFR